MKNSLFRKMLAVGATLALVSSFFVAVPVSAAPGCNAWGDINMPDLKPNTEVSVMDVAPDGTIFLAVYFENGAQYKDVTAEHWYVYYSTDGGFTWSKTNMPGVLDTDPNEQGVTPGDATPVAIKVSPMWPSNKNVYVALSNGDVWRLPNAGLGTPAKLKGIVDAQSQVLGTVTSPVTGRDTCLWDMDIWADGTYNYLAVATDLDVFVIKDQLLAEWVDYELNVELIATHQRIAREVRFAPDFATSELIWTVVRGDGVAHNDCPEGLATPGLLTGGDLYLVSADSPARWGHVFKPVTFELYSEELLVDTRFVDIAFDPDYTSALPQLYVAAGGDGYISQIPGNLWFVSGEAKTSGPGEMDSSYIFFEDQPLGSVQVSGSTIMVQNVWTGVVYTTNDRGNTWPEAKRSPAGKAFGNILMSPNYATDKTVYSAVMDGRWWTGVTQFGISGFYRSTDGGVFFDGISWLDMPANYAIRDLTFDPKGGSQPALMVLNTDADFAGVDYIFYTGDATAAKVQWLMKDSMENYGETLPLVAPGSSLEAIDMISWDAAGDVVMFMGMKKDGTTKEQYYVFRSYDEGNSFDYWRKLPVDTVGVPADWVVVDNNTVSVAGSLGYWGTRAIGTEIKNNLTFAAASIARRGDNIAIGSIGGGVRVSTDGGKTWSVTAVSVGNTPAFVAFGPDGVLYAVAGNTDGTGTVATINVGATVPVSSVVAGQNGKLLLSDASGIWVSPDNALYVMATPAASTSGNIIGSGAITFGEEEEAGLAGDGVTYTIPDVKITIDPIVVTNNKSFVSGESLNVVAADVKASSSSMASGYIIVEGATSGAVGYVDITIKDSTNPFSMFGDWPADISVSFDGVQVASSSGESFTALFRLLLGEKDNVWEQKAKEGVGTSLWGTTGSNLLWTLTGGRTGIAALEDFNSGKVQNVTVKEIDKDSTKAVKTLEVSWTALPCTTVYEVYVDGAYFYWAYWANAVAGSTLSVEIPDMDYATSYDVQVRAADSWNSYGSAIPALKGSFQSRLSAVASVTTECYNVAPTPQVPVQGMQDASLAPSFVWAAPTAGCAPVKYDFQLSTDPNFGSFIIDTTVTGTGYTYTARDLAYDTNHYWRVRSVAADGTKSNWTTVQNFHTMLEPVEPVPPVTVTQNPPQTLTVTVPPMVTVPPAQTVTVSVPPAVTLTQTVTSVAGPTISLPDQPTPAYIWVIVAVGAVLTIAVIVLIVRTRRAE